MTVKSIVTPSPFIEHLENIFPGPFDGDAVIDLDFGFFEEEMVEKLFRIQNFAECEFQFHSHQLVCPFGLHAGLKHIILRDQAVIAAIDILHLRLHLFARPQKQWLHAFIVRVSWDDRPLAVEHFKDREFCQFAELAVLKRNVRHQYRIGAYLEARAVSLRRKDEAPLHQMFPSTRKALRGPLRELRSSKHPGSLPFA